MFAWKKRRSIFLFHQPKQEGIAFRAVIDKKNSTVPLFVVPTLIVNTIALLLLPSYAESDGFAADAPIDPRLLAGDVLIRHTPQQHSSAVGWFLFL